MGLGVFSLFLLIGQFSLSQIALNSTGTMKESVLKGHVHLGPVMFAITLAYILTSLWMVINSPTKPRSRP